MEGHASVNGKNLWQKLLLFHLTSISSRLLLLSLNFGSYLRTCLFNIMYCMLSNDISVPDFHLMSKFSLTLCLNSFYSPLYGYQFVEICHNIYLNHDLHDPCFMFQNILVHFFFSICVFRIFLSMGIRGVLVADRISNSIMQMYHFK